MCCVRLQLRFVYIYIQYLKIILCDKNIFVENKRL